MRSKFCYALLFCFFLSSANAAVGSKIGERTTRVQHLVLTELQVSEEDYQNFKDTPFYLQGMKTTTI